MRMLLSFFMAVDGIDDFQGASMNGLRLSGSSASLEKVSTSIRPVNLSSFLPLHTGKHAAVRFSYSAFRGAI
jgi:hypothetical protein